MNAFWLAVLKNILIGIALSLLSAVFYRPAKNTSTAPVPEANDFAPTADEGTEIKHLFGTGPVELLVVAVMDRQVDAIRH